MAFQRIVQFMVGPIGGNGKLLTNLYMKFEVKKGLTAPQHDAKATIYNLANDTFQQYVKQNNALVIQAGYADELNGAQPPTVFSGVILEAVRKRDHADWIVEIHAVAGVFEVWNQPVAVSYGAGASVAQILQDIAGRQLGVLLHVVGTLPTKTFANGYTYGPGAAAGAFDELCGAIGWDYFTKGLGEVVIQPKGPQAALSAVGYILSQQTGLLLPPEMEGMEAQYASAGQLPKNIGATQYWKFTSLLYPQIQPGSVVGVVSPSLPGTSLRPLNAAYFSVVNAVYTGDSREGDWKIEAECLNVSEKMAS